ncbi:MAG: DUF2268 domain-containing putative Zn-dependent protease [bacterium]|nr:DUF2268 domain-containing putative Zn-dependent protease [bacterium]
MKRIDLTAHCPDDPEDSVAVADYERHHQPLFDHYNRYWTVADYPYVVMDAGAKKDQTELVLKALKDSEEKFGVAGLDISDLKVILFVGKGTSNGHALRNGTDWIVWLPVETYPTKGLADTFIPHEIAHALHYQSTPGLYFESQSEKDDLLRQLIVEGLATYVTKIVCGMDETTALWADFLSVSAAESWFEDCRQRLPELSQQILDGMEHGENLSRYFRADDDSDVTTFRAGYYVGLKVIYAIVQSDNLSIKELLSLPSETFKEQARQQLRLMCAGE